MLITDTPSTHGGCCPQGSPHHHHPVHQLQGQLGTGMTRRCASSAPPMVLGGPGHLQPRLGAVTSDVVDGSEVGQRPGEPLVPSCKARAGMGPGCGAAGQLAAGRSRSLQPLPGSQLVQPHANTPWEPAFPSVSTFLTGPSTPKSGGPQRSGYPQMVPGMRGAAMEPAPPGRAQCPRHPGRGTGGHGSPCPPQRFRQQPARLPPLLSAKTGNWSGLVRALKPPGSVQPYFHPPPSPSPQGTAPPRSPPLPGGSKHRAWHTPQKNPSPPCPAFPLTQQWGDETHGCSCSFGVTPNPPVPWHRPGARTHPARRRRARRPRASPARPSSPPSPPLTGTCSRF